MKTCPHCGGTLLRNGITRYTYEAMIGVRYRCKECGKSFTKRLWSDILTGLSFGNTGRPIKKDWRHAN